MTSRLTNVENNRLVELDSLRGLAAMSVVYFHYTFQYRTHFGHDFMSSYDFQLGKQGVFLFFMISGFVIHLTIEKVKSPKEFLLKRFTRLYPVYWFCLIFTFLTVSIFGLPGKETSLIEGLIGLTMIQDLFGVKHVDESYWSLLPEIQFYIFVFLILLTKMEKHIVALAIAWLFITCFSSIIQIPGVPSFYKFRYNVLFFSGMMFYQIWKGNRTWWYHLCILLSYAFWIVMVKDWKSVLLATFFFGIFYLISYSSLKLLRLPVLIFLGRISYPLYLIHQFIGYIIMNTIRPMFGESVLLMTSIPIVICVLLAWAVSSWIEYPLIHMSRKWVNKIV